MEKNFRTIDIKILNDFIESGVYDIYALVKQLYFKDMYMSIYQYYFDKLSRNSSLEKFVDGAYYIYKKQNKLNSCLKVTSGKYYDQYLLKCVVHELYEEFGETSVLSEISKDDFKKLILEYDKQCIDNELINEYNVNVLTSAINNKFSNKDNVKISEVIDFIKGLSEENLKVTDYGNYFEYLNELIAKKNITLNQLGLDSKTGKRIYELTMDKMPTKNQLLMLMFSLKLNKEEQNTLLVLAKENVKNTSSSNRYSFENESDRDKLILHWLDNILELEKIGKKTNKSIVGVVNDMLRHANYDILS